MYVSPNLPSLPIPLPCIHTSMLYLCLYLCPGNRFVCTIFLASIYRLNSKSKSSELLTGAGSARLCTHSSAVSAWPVLTPSLDVWNTPFPHAQTTCRSIRSSQTFVVELRPIRVLIQLSYWFSPASQGFCHKLPAFPSFSLAPQPLQQGDSAHQATKSLVSSFMHGAGAERHPTLQG